jgi:4'-phosphopantetheinyl transferase
VAHLWVARPEELEASAEALALMDPDESTRQKRFIFPQHRHEYLATRVLVRRVLGSYLDVPPASLRFVSNEHGRPELDVPGSPLRFNLSNTPGLVVCLVSAHHEVGVDTELRARAASILNIANTVFAEAELRELLALEGDAQAHRAVTLWTLKEAYIKARGMGLALPLEKFAFQFANDVRIDIDPSLKDEGSRWQFRTLELGAHLVSTAIACTADEPVAIAVRHVDGAALTPTSG